MPDARLSGSDGIEVVLARGAIHTIIHVLCRCREDGLMQERMNEEGVFVRFF